MEQIDRDIFGVTDKECKEYKRAAGGRRPDPAILALAAIHKFDTAKYLKDDKIMKLSKTWMKK